MAVSGDSKPHSRVEPSTIETRFISGTYTKDDVAHLLESLEVLADEKRQLEEQLETHEAMLRRVLRYLNGSRYLVGADGLAEDVEALLSNPASEPDFYTEERRRLEGTHGG